VYLGRKKAHPSKGSRNVDDLIIRFLGGHASPFEAERLKRWREESQENESAYREIARVWELTAPEPITEAAKPPRVEELVGKTLPTPKTSFRLRERYLTRWGFLAASVAALAIGTQILRNPTPLPLASYQAPADQSLTVTLADGSFARLAPGSSLEEFEGVDTREVTLRGQGFFAVARDEDRPFRVRAGSGEVRVLGTRFQIKEGPDGGFETVVVEGRVAVANRSGQAEIMAGQMAQAREGVPPTVTEPEDIYALLDWSEGTLVFQGTPLSHVAEEVSRHFGRSLRVVSEEIQNRRVTAWFSTESFEEVAESLCLVTEAVCDPSGDGVIMVAGTEEETVR
jgi:transmembrane sensor